MDTRDESVGGQLEVTAIAGSSHEDFFAIFGKSDGSEILKRCTF